MIAVGLEKWLLFAFTGGGRKENGMDGEIRLEKWKNEGVEYKIIRNIIIRRRIIIQQWTEGKNA